MSTKPVLHTVLSPRLLDIYDISNSIVVVIDVFRATSTIATALYNGATRVIPVDSVDKCIQIGKNTGGITAGERDGKIIPGLEHGNSPAEYPREFIEGKTLVAGAVIERVKSHFTIHCDSSLMAENMYQLHKNDLKGFIRNTTHWHRLAQYGLEKDLEYCVTPDQANILPFYKNGDLIVKVSGE
jgi:2-phosphosulfolactate phosphatase